MRLPSSASGSSVERSSRAYPPLLCLRRHQLHSLDISSTLPALFSLDGSLFYHVEHRGREAALSRGICNTWRSAWCRKSGQQVFARGAQNRESDLDNKPQLWDLEMLYEVLADLAAATRFKNQRTTCCPRHLPAHKVSRRAGAQFNLPACRKIGTEMKWRLRQSRFGKHRKVTPWWESTQASRHWLWQQEIHGLQAKSERILFACASDQSKKATRGGIKITR